MLSRYLLRCVYIEMALTSVQAELLKVLPEDYNYLFSQEENTNNTRRSTTRTFRVELTSAESVQEWINSFANRNNVIWRKSKTSAVSGRYVLYKADLRCQHNSDKRSNKKGTRISKNTNCPAKLKVTLNRYLKNSRARKPATLNKDWPCVVELIDDHNHSLTDASALRFQDLSQYTKNKLLDLYQQGHTPSTALKYLKAELLLEHPEDYETFVTDGRFIPTLSVCSHLFNKEVKESGNLSQERKLQNLQSSVQLYNESSSGKAILENVDCHSCIALCSPIMQRAHKFLDQSSEMVLVEVFGGNNPKKHRAYFFITPTPAGGIPLGVIITNIDTEAVLSKALENLKKCFPGEAFFGKNFPSIILRGNNMKGCEPLQNSFPESKVLLCQYSVLKSVWAWLCNSKNEIETVERQRLYFAYKDLLYAETESLMNENYKKCLELATAYKYPKFIGYLEQNWKDRRLWSSSFRTSSPIMDQNYIEVIFRVLKSCILEKVSGFGINQLFDFIVTKYESYIEQWLLDFCHSRISKSLIKRSIPSHSEFIVPENIVPHAELKDCFLVISKMEENFIYNTVDIKNAICTCGTGKICFHIASVILEHSINDIFSVVSTKFKEIVFNVATGLKHSEAYESDSGSEVEKNEQIMDLSNENVEKKVLQVEKLFERISNSIRTNPSTFIPAVENMCCNTVKYLQNDDDLAFACHSFGESGGQMPAINSKKVDSSIILKQSFGTGTKNYSIGQKRNGIGRPLLPKPKLQKTIEL